MAGGRDKFKPSAHYCRTPTILKRKGRRWVCRECWAVYTCKEVKGRLVWLQTKDGRKP